MPTDLAHGPWGAGIAWQARRSSCGGCGGVRGAGRLPVNLQFPRAPSDR